MSLSDFRAPVLGLASLALLTGPAFAFTEVQESKALEFPLEYRTVAHPIDTKALAQEPFGRSVNIGEGWMVRTNHWSGNVRMAFGGQYQLAPGVYAADQAETLARNFLTSNGDMLGTRADNVDLKTVVNRRGKYVAHYRQMVGGLEVYGSNAFVVMGENGNLMAFGSDFFPESEIIARPSLSKMDAIVAAANALNAEPNTALPIEGDLYLVPAQAGEVMELTPAWRVLFESEQPYGKWETFVHGTTGEILGRRNFYHPINVVGNSDSQVQNQFPSLSYCDGEGLEVNGFANVTVSGGNTAVTDANGDFDINHGGSTIVSVTTEFNGPYTNVNRFGGLGADASLTLNMLPGVPDTFSWTDANSRQDERDTFFHGNVIRNFMVNIDPSFIYLDGPVTSIVGRTDGFCPGNAWWSIGAQTMNYCEAGGSNENTGEMANVIYHEYGHGITDELYAENGQSQPPGGLHEGNSDVVANFLDRNSIIGIGFFTGNCVSGIRDASNSLTWPSSNENGGHSAGQVIAGFHWEAWQAMLGAMPQATADEIAFRTWHDARAMGFPQTFIDQVTWTFIADDDDANLDNGTPNYDFFCNAATLKGMGSACPEILSGVIIGHQPLPNVEGDGTGPGYDVGATIVSTETALDPTKLLVHYRYDGGGFQQLTMTATGNPDEFKATIPEPAGSAVVDYYITAEDINGNTDADPSLAPGLTHTFAQCETYLALEAGTTGWTIGDVGDNATTGVWERIDPIGTEAQPEDDSTADPFGTEAFITGQCNPTCSLGSNDIDGGTTTLRSPIWDLSGLEDVRVQYDRWYSNNTGADPGNDTWVVDVSNDGGGSWTNVESTTATAAAWTTVTVDIDALFGAGAANLVQLRFRASDLGAGSIVEAGVDEVCILASPSLPVNAPTIGVGSVAALELQQAQPNPFIADTKINFAVPATANVELSVYNVSGQKVRTLEAGRLAAGRHTTSWDGRDQAGERVAAGVYFYRLTSDAQTLTKKMTVLK